MSQQKSTILFILHLPPPVHGASMMGKYIYDSKLINSSFNCKYINLATAKSLEDIGKVRVRKIFTLICLIRNIVSTVKECRPDIVYVTPNSGGGAFLKDFLVVGILKLFNCKVILHYHNKGVSRYQNSFLFNWCYRRFFKGVKVILLADILFYDIEKYVSKNDVYICHNGIPYDKDIFTLNEKKNSKPVLLFLSNLIISKGALMLLEACKILKEKGYEFVCKVVGGETVELTKEIYQQEIEKRDLQGWVRYEGRKYGEEKNKAFEEADIFVFPTFYHNECFPVVLLEAMSFGVPSVTTNEGGISAIVQDGMNGIICQKESPLALSEGIELLLIDVDKRKEMGMAGQKRFQELFTVDKYEETLTRIFSELIS